MSPFSPHGARFLPWWGSVANSVPSATAGFGGESWHPHGRARRASVDEFRGRPNTTSTERLPRTRITAPLFTPWADSVSGSGTGTDAGPRGTSRRNLTARRRDFGAARPRGATSRFRRGAQLDGATSRFRRGAQLDGASSRFRRGAQLDGASSRLRRGTSRNLAGPRGAQLDGASSRFRRGAQPSRRRDAVAARRVAASARPAQHRARRTDGRQAPSPTESLPWRLQPLASNQVRGCATGGSAGGARRTFSRNPSNHPAELHGSMQLSGYRLPPWWRQLPRT